MSSLLREVIPLALAAAISPVIFLLQLNTLTGDRPSARGAALTAGAAIVLIVVSTIGVLVGDTGFSTNDTLKAAINIGFGALLVAVGLRALLRPPKPKAPRTDAKPPSIGGSFLAGAGGMASNLTTFALYTPALALIAGSGLPPPPARHRRADHPADHAHGGMGAAGARGRGPGRINSLACCRGWAAG
jgi:Sap-like sulfolipid-1-addressing protein